MKKFLNSLGLFFFVLKEFYKQKPSLYRNLIILTILTAFIPVITKFFEGKLIDTAVSTLGNKSLNSTSTFIIYIIGLSLLFFITNIFYLLKDYFDQKSGLYRNVISDKLLLQKYLSLDVSTFDNPEFIKLKTKIEWNIWQIFTSVIQPINILSYSLIIVFNLILLSLYDFRIIPLIFASVIPDTIVISKFGKLIWNIWDTHGEEKIKYNIYKRSFYTENIERFQELKIFGYGQYLYNKAQKLNQKFIKRVLNKENKRLKYNILGAVIDYTLVFLILLILFNDLERSVLSIGTFYFIYSLTFQTKNNIKYVSYTLSSLNANIDVLKAFKKFSEFKPQIQSGSIKLKADKPIQIEFKNVSFKYPKTDKLVLKNINLKIIENQDIAIVGKNGAGKTTLLKLIMRVYDPIQGEIFINGINLKKIDLDSLYNQISFLSQNFNFPEIAVKEAIYIGNTKAPFNMRDIQMAARKAQAHDFIKSYPKKYNSFLTKEIKGGIIPSGGQKQRIAIARTFFRKPRLLILDEPTSSIDAIAEEKIFSNIYKYAQNKTVIIISHRFSTVKQAEKIFVLDKGQIIENGSHKELLRQNGLYAKMYNSQMR